jgi:hypothetical protein
MDCFYGEPMLFRIESFDDNDVDVLPVFKAASMCKDVGVLDAFFDEYLPGFDNSVSWFFLFLFFMFILLFI